MAQRLVRTICTECKEPYEPHEVPSDFPHNGGPVRLWHGRGCRACRQSGFRGRTGIYELMVTGDTIRDLVVQRINASVIRKQALKEGMITLRQDGWRKVQQGITTIDEVARVTAGDIIA
jgi:general secretion pathway protein E/type IV pilus assembly protein PilB